MLKTNVFFGLHRSFERVDVMKGCDRYKPYFKTRCFSRQTERKEKEFNFKCSFEPKRSTSVTRLYIQLTQKNDTSNLIPLYFCLSLTARKIVNNVENHVKTA